MKNIKEKIYFLSNKISSLFPRSKHIFVFIGWHKSKYGEVFADNTKYLFLHASKDKENKAIWISKSKRLAEDLRNRGLDSYYEKSLVGIFYMLRAGYFVIDAYLQDNKYALSGGAKIIQLLHGKGLKKKGYYEKPKQKHDLIFGTSKYALSLLGKDFVGNAKIFSIGYPRNDVFFQKDIEEFVGKEEKDFLNLIQDFKDKNQKIVLYAPTFRRGEKEFDFEKRLNLEKLNSFAKEKNIVFLLSLHTKYRAQKEFAVHDKLVFMPDIDIYPILPRIDLLVTDYSSSFADFVLLDKPIVFYVYDIEKYNKEEGLVEDYVDSMPGEFVYDFENLLKTVESTVLQNKDNFSEKRLFVRNKYHELQDGKSSERIWDILKQTQE